MKDVSADYTVTATDICTGQLIQVTYSEPVSNNLFNHMVESSANVQLQIDDDPFPAIAGHQISGEAFPGRELQARGYSINGTTSCNFEWVRNLEDGSVDYIDGAPKYLVTAGDVNTEVQALDDIKNKGENVKVLAKERRKICSDPELQDFNERTLYNVPASYRISLLTGHLGIWEPEALAIKREGYGMKCSGSSGVVVNEMFSPSTTIDDDPLPAIADLQISGEAFLGGELQACGYSINGTTSCNFEWVRHLEDGSVDYIKGAQQPNHLVTADDVNTYLAIEIQPLDDRKRKGEIVKVFANERRKVVCDPEMQNHIERTLYNGHASYRISVLTGYLDIWELATLTIKREGYSIKWNGSSGVVVSQKFSQSTTVTIPYGQPTEFFISSSNNSQQVLRADNSMDSNSSRDSIVLTLRSFILRILNRSQMLHLRTNHGATVEFLPHELVRVIETVSCKVQGLPILGT